MLTCSKLKPLAMAAALLCAAGAIEQLARALVVEQDRARRIEYDDAFGEVGHQRGEQVAFLFHLAV